MVGGFPDSLASAETIMTTEQYALIALGAVALLSLIANIVLVVRFSNGKLLESAFSGVKSSLDQSVGHELQASCLTGRRYVPGAVVSIRYPVGGRDWGSNAGQHVLPAPQHRFYRTYANSCSTRKCRRRCIDGTLSASHGSSSQTERTACGIFRLPPERMLPKHLKRRAVE
jgi:hypothetical protein